MNQMRELFEKEYPLPEGASFNGSFYTAPYPAAGVSDHNVRWAAWEKAFQAAQSVSVPVVGEVVAWQRRLKYPSAPGAIAEWHQCNAHEAFDSFSRNPLFEYRSICKPTTSISAAELDALRKDADSLIAAKELLLIWQSWFGSSRNRCDDAGKKLWDRIEAIAGEKK